jgi:DNA-binding GntR family transcriptional regulator
MTETAGRNRPIRVRRTRGGTKVTPAQAQPKVQPAPPQHFSRPLWLAEILRDRIMAGVYAPGERVREADLQKEFGFSNGPIREALQLIVADGLAERPPWQGVRVVALTEQQIIELFQVRLALLEYAAELAAGRASPDAIRTAPALRRSIDERFSKTAKEHWSFGGKLSQWLLAAAGNERLKQIWDKTMLPTMIYVNAAMLRKGVGSRSRMLIHNLIDAVVAGKVAVARKAARDLTRQTLTDLDIKGSI